MPRNQHQPSQEERDERLKIDLDPDKAIKLIMETGEGARANLSRLTQKALVLTRQLKGSSPRRVRQDGH